MSDLPERIGLLMDECDFTDGQFDTLAEAQSEIEQLEAERDALQAKINRVEALLSSWAMHDIHAEFVDAIDELEAALKESNYG